MNGLRSSGGPAPCSGLRRIQVFAEAGADRVNLSGVTRSAFDHLRSVIVRGEDGIDTLIGSKRGDELGGGGGTDILRGGPGPDHLRPGRGSGDLVGGDGRDLVTVSADDDWEVDDARITRAGSSDEITPRVGRAGAGDRRPE